MRINPHKGKVLIIDQEQDLINGIKSFFNSYDVNILKYTYDIKKHMGILYDAIIANGDTDIDFHLCHSGLSFRSFYCYYSRHISNYEFLRYYKDIRTMNDGKNTIQDIIEAIDG